MSDRDEITGTFTWGPPTESPRPTTTITRTSTASEILGSPSGTSLGKYTFTTVAEGAPISAEGSEGDMLTYSEITDIPQTPEPTMDTTAILGAIRSMLTGTPTIPMSSGLVDPDSTETAVIPVITGLPLISEPTPTDNVLENTTNIDISVPATPTINTTLITSFTPTPTSATNPLGYGPLTPLETVPPPTTNPLITTKPSTITIAAIAAGAIIFLAFLIALAYFLYRAHKSPRKTSRDKIKTTISNPVRPPSEKAETVRTLPDSPRRSPTYPSQTTNATLAPSPTWSSTTPQVLITPAPHPRIASSIYPSYLEDHPQPCTDPPPPQEFYTDIGNPHEPQNLVVPPGRRRRDVISSWMSNGNYKMFGAQTGADRSSYTSNFAFELGDVGRAPLGSIAEDVGSDGSLYGPVLELYGDCGLGEGGEGDVIVETGQGSREGVGGDDQWENKRRELFEGR